jgi:hypothetical protein
LDPSGKVLHHMTKCKRPPWYNPTTITVLQTRPTSNLRLRQWENLCHHLATLPIPGPWIPNQQLRLRGKTYVLPDVIGSTPSQTEVGAYIHFNNPRIGNPIPPLYQFIAAAVPSQSPVIITPSLIPRDFKEYLVTLPKWEQVLLAHIQWHTDPFHTMQKIHDMHPEDQLLVVLDGSSHELRSMSFGFAIGTHSGIPLLENMGPAYGKPSSHCAESTGCISGALALKHLQTFTQILFPPQLQTVVISDNEQMIKSFTDHATYHSVYPNATLVPDWDLLAEIHQQYCRSFTSLHINYQWVRGHQDTSTDLGGLPSEAKLNVQAYLLAAEYNTIVDSRKQPRTPLMSATQCILQISGDSIHVQYPANLQRSAAKASLSEYLTGK